MVKIVVVFGALQLIVMNIVWAERRVSAWMQDRLGPNRVGPQGLLQGVADGLKNMLKEETMPANAEKGLFVLAPALAFIPAMMTQAVIPFASPLPVRFDWTWPLVGRIAYDGAMPMVIADLPVGFLYILALTSLGVYGVVLAGWSSGSKYSLLGGLRSSAQLISYEIAAGMSLIAVMILSGNVSLTAIVAKQQESVWFVFALSISFVVFLVTAFAETNRLPFDMPETESELVAGYHAEYSSMKFLVFLVAEYANLFTASALMATLFFGGWDIPFTTWDQGAPTVLKSLVTLVLFLTKTLSFCFVFIWVRWTLPRFRFDQVMQLGWKFLLPLAIAYVMVIATSVYALDLAGVAFGARYGAILFALNVVILYLVFWLLDRGRLIRGARAGYRPAAVRSSP
ncbi:MAG: NADH-quinone oxidoreductase subunit NuoH [Gemmatimonadetes bacterium]|nr:NADH-quinone oxidoreductase subunit NuoH [Gemmatimonadota bacterium]